MINITSKSSVEYKTPELSLLLSLTHLRNHTEQYKFCTLGREGALTSDHTMGKTMALRTKRTKLKCSKRNVDSSGCIIQNCTSAECQTLCWRKWNTECKHWNYWYFL